MLAKNNRIMFVTMLAISIACLAQTNGVAAVDSSKTYRKIFVKDEGNRVVEIEPISETKTPHWAKNVSADKWEWRYESEPYFEGPIPFVRPPIDFDEPFFKHNHQPAITWLDNGDLLSIWYTTENESGTELTVLASRLRVGNEQWDPSSEFFKAEGRNMHGSSIFNDKKGKLYHLNGMGAENVTRSETKNMAFLVRTSVDNGITWTVPSIIGPEYKMVHQAISGAIVTNSGVIIQVCDSVRMKGSIRSVVFISKDNGKSWDNPMQPERSSESENATDKGNAIAGIHAGIVELKDGRLMAMGRGLATDGNITVSISNDMGKTWSYERSEFPDIGTGQRLVLMRLREGPLLLVSFTDGLGKNNEKNGMSLNGRSDDIFKGYGMFAAVSFDDGESWPIKKMITPGDGEYYGGAWTGEFRTTAMRAEPGGYLAGTQSPDGIIHLVSSRLHYRFNLAWLKKEFEVLDGPL